MCFSVTACICRYIHNLMLPMCAARPDACRQGRLLEISSYFWHQTSLFSENSELSQFHLAVAHLCCLDTRLSRPDGLIKFNWWERNDKFIKVVRMVLPYTDTVGSLFYKIAPFLGGMKKPILEASTAENVDAMIAIQRMNVRAFLPDEHNEGEFVVTEQRPARGGSFVLIKPVWARPTLSSCNGLLSYCKALDLAAELWPPLSRYKGDNFIICIGIFPHQEHESYDSDSYSCVQPAEAAECPANGLAKRVCKYQTYSTVPSCVT